MDGGDYNNNNNILNINEEKALGYDNIHRRRCLGSFEDDGDGNSPDRFNEDDDRTVEDEDDDGDESGSNVSQDRSKRTIYWESQEALLQVN